MDDIISGVGFRPSWLRLPSPGLQPSTSEFGSSLREFGRYCVPSTIVLFWGMHLL